MECWKLRCACLGCQGTIREFRRASSFQKIEERTIYQKYPFREQKVEGKSRIKYDDVIVKEGCFEGDKIIKENNV